MADLDRVTINQLNPITFVPHGDRYLIKKLNIENAYVVDMGDGTMKKITLDGTEDIESRDGYWIGEIICVGNGHRLEADVTVPMPHMPGDVVMVEKYSGREIKVGGKPYRVVNQTDVLNLMPELCRPQNNEKRRIAAITPADPTQRRFTDDEIRADLHNRQTGTMAGDALDDKRVQELATGLR